MATAPTRRPRSLAKDLVFACIPLLVLLATLELVVRVLRLDQSCPSAYNENAVWACDPILKFKLRPNLIVEGKPLNSAGSRSREFGPKAPGVFRVLSLGDSCTFGILNREGVIGIGYVAEPYPQRLERLAAERIGAGRLEVLNAGMPGYNSFQGVMLLRSKLRGLEPDLITVRYGWNDHFMSAQDGGAYAGREPDNELVLGLQDLMQRTSLYGFLHRLGFEARALLARAAPPPRAAFPTQWQPSVPLDAYEHNLRRMVALGRAQGAQVWLLTAPHAFVIDTNRGRGDEFPMSAKQLLAFNAIRSFEHLIEIHDRYNQATREVGAELGVPVVDVDAVYRAHADEPLFLPIDVPHPTPLGHALEAETLYERLLAEGLVRP